MIEGGPGRGSLRATGFRLGLFVFLTVTLCAPITAAAATKAPAVNSGDHLYRHGVVPFLGRQKTSAASAPRTAHDATASPNDVSYGGGIGGVGVTTGHEKVYLVFWGSQWGTRGTNSSGYATFSGDPQGVAPDLEAFFKGLGTGGETWSGVMTQYCQGVATGATSCPASNKHHVAYPLGGALAGVWEDKSAAAPASATGNQIATEAVNAATHFGRTTQSSNRNTQYFIVSPTGTDPDNYENQGFCSWHDDTADSSLDGGGAVSSPDGTLAFTNLPYLPDVGTTCGQNFVNAGPAGTLDGVTIVGGREYAQTITDQYPAGGWTVPSGADVGEEVGDLCAWITPGQPGGSQDISLTTGSFAVQSIWANDYNGGAGGCEVSHPIVTNPGNTVTVTNPGNQSSTPGVAVSLQIHASDSASGQKLKYSASGLPAGLSINTSSGLISGTPTTTGTSTVTVTAVDTTGAFGTASFTWSVSSCVSAQLLGNPGFETGSAAPWTTTPGVINSNGGGETAHSGSWYAWLDGYGTTHTDTLAQQVSIPAGCTNYTFSFWLHIDTDEATTTTAYDTLKVQVLNSAGTVLGTLATYSNLNAASGYTQRSFNVASYAGQTVTLKFTGTEDATLQTSFVIDDTALNVS